MKEVVVIGAGPSGLILSNSLAGEKFKVSIIDQNSKIGKKLLTTGSELVILLI